MSIIDPVLAARVSETGVPLSADLAVPKLRTLDQVEDELIGVSLSLYEEELENARLRLALKSAQRGRRELRELLDSPPSFDEIEARVRVSEEWERLRARVAELEAERHSTNEALDDAVQALRAKQEQPAPMYVSRALPRRDAVEDVTPQVAKLRALLAGQREDRHDSPLHHDYRVPRDLPEIGRA
ncbi:hypothetical protein [Streptomyces kaempferi]|uniref:Uncharacterized protein n=1 Tax=Streptomyces kaempferi TaxID=333725 RepID=A0ABW3XUA6_9ACTN